MLVLLVYCWCLHATTKFYGVCIGFTSTGDPTTSAATACSKGSAASPTPIFGDTEIIRNTPKHDAWCQLVILVFGIAAFLMQ